MAKKNHSRLLLVQMRTPRSSFQAWAEVLQLQNSILLQAQHLSECENKWKTILMPACLAAGEKWLSFISDRKVTPQMVTFWLQTSKALSSFFVSHPIVAPPDRRMVGASLQLHSATATMSNPSRIPSRSSFMRRISILKDLRADWARFEDLMSLLLFELWYRWPETWVPLGHV